MRDRDFEFWLEGIYKTASGEPVDRKTRQDTLANCRRVERYLGDLDLHYTEDGMGGLLRKFDYGRAEESRGIPPPHGIPIGGTSTQLRRA